MDQNDRPVVCQLNCVSNLSVGLDTVPPESIIRRLRLFIRRNLNAHQVRTFKMKTSRIFYKLFQQSDQPKQATLLATNMAKAWPQANELVRIKSVSQIKATLNPWGQLKGCMFMPEMAQYCNTTQRVYKRLERFVDENDFYVKKSNGMVLLEGLYCQGTKDYGRCDRSCFYFWREEWLEEVSELP